MSNVQDAANNDVTCDTLFARRLYCLQHRHGYRFSLDAILAAHFSIPAPDAKILDLCCGCGVIALICLYRWQSRITNVTCLELQEGLAGLAERNRSLNGFEAQMRVVQGDLRRILDLFEPESFTQVVCNPPFYPQKSGRPCLDEESFVARHQVHCTLTEVVRAAAAVVKNRGRAIFVYPASNLELLLAACSIHALTLKRLQIIYSYPDLTAPARLVLLETIKNGGPGAQVLPPFYIYERRSGPYAPAMRRLYDPEWGKGSQNLNSEETSEEKR